MLYIRKIPNSTGNHGAPDSNMFDGLVGLPDEFLDTYLQYNGFVHLTLEGDTVTSVSPNTEAWESWKMTEAEKTAVPVKPTDAERLAALESAMLELLGGASNV